MSDAYVVPETAVPVTVEPLGQVARVVDTFVAPRKTFTDVLRSSNCWLAVLLMVVFTFGFAAVVAKKVGWATVQQVQISKNPSAEAQMAQLPADQREARMAIGTKITGYATYASFVFVVIFMLIEALIVWGAFNFGLGASTKFGQVFAVIAFSALPRAIFVPLISAVLLFAGVGVDNFDIRNPVGTNLGYYLQDSAHWMAVAGGFFDLFGLWSLALMVIGMSIVARKTIAQSATVIVGLWLLILIVVTGFAAI